MILAALVMCISTMLAVQIHREIGHADHIISLRSAQLAHRPGRPTVLVSYCPLCDLGFQAESAPPLPIRLVMDRMPARLRHGDASSRFLMVTSTGHIWRSRAPPDSPAVIA